MSQTADATPKPDSRIRRTWPILVLVNLAALAGILSTLFTLPGNIHFWMWAITSLIVLALVNYTAVVAVRNRRRQNKTSESKTVTIIIYVGFVFFVLDLLYGCLLYTSPS